MKESLWDQNLWKNGHSGSSLCAPPNRFFNSGYIASQNDLEFEQGQYLKRQKCMGVYGLEKTGHHIGCGCPPQL